MYYKIFVDESGSKEYINPYSKEFVDNPPLFDAYPKFWQDNYFALCGVRVKQEDIGEINQSINALKKNYFGTHEIEVKSDWLRNPHQRKKRYLKPFKVTPAKLNAFGEEFIDLIARYKKELKLFAVVFDKRFYGDAKRKKEEGHPLSKATQVLFERFEYSVGYNIITFDQMESSLRLTHGRHDKILNVYSKNSGMDIIYVDQYTKITDIQFKKSSNENFLQIADICAYNVFRQFCEHGREWFGQQVDGEGKTSMKAYKYFDKIRCNFAHHPVYRNKVRGIGLTCLPDAGKVDWDLLRGCFAEDKNK